MDVLPLLLDGLATAATPENLFWVLVGAVLGTIVGIMPGLGPPGVIAVLLPLTLTLEPASGLIMLAGIFYGSKYGSSTTGILLNIPGDSNAVPAALEGYPMAKAGRAGPALGITTIISFVAGTVSVIGLTLFAPLVTRIALGFGPPEYFTLMLMGLASVVVLAGSSMAKGLISACLGLLLASVGVDIMSGQARFTFGMVPLIDGVEFIAVIIGLFALGEVFINLESMIARQKFDIPKKLRELLPTKKDLKDSSMPMVRGSIIGFFIGVLPGAGATAASFISYTTEHRISKEPETFGHGNIKGLAASESANNAATGGALIPLLTLGIPGGGTTAVLLGALILYGLQPGPLLFEQNPDIVWPLIASMYIGNLALLFINLPLIPVFASVLRLPYYILYPIIVAVAVVGVYGVNRRVFDLWLLLIFGVLGYLMRKIDMPAAPLVLAFVLGPLVERALRQSIIISRGDLTIFFRSGLSIAFVIGTLLMLSAPLVRRLRGTKSASDIIEEKKADSS